MRHDIQQLAGRGTVNDSSITTLSTEGVTRSPSSSPRRVRFNEPEARAAQPQYGPTRPLRSAAGNNSMFTPSFRGDQRARTNERYNGRNNRLTLYVLNVDDDNMKMHFVAQLLGNSVGRAPVLDISRVYVVRGIDRIYDGRLVAIDQTIVVRYITIIQLI